MSAQNSVPIAAVVLAGGASSRMGSDKAALDIAGQPMLSRVVTALASRCAPIAVVATDRSPAYLELHTHADLAESIYWVTDEQADTGPLGALAAGLADLAAAGHALAFACATDMPMVSAELVDELLSSLGSSDDVVVAVDDDRVHPLAAIYRTRCAEQVAQAVVDGERRMLAVLDDLHVHRVSVSRREWLTNVNAPEDVHRLRA